MMKKLTILSMCLMMIFSLSFAQKKASNVKTVSKFKMGTVLTQADIAFMSLAADKKAESGKGAQKSSVTLGDKTFTVKQKLTKDDAAFVNTTIADYTKSHPGSKMTSALPKTRGDLCWQWYYTCSDGTCYYYKYYYYCY